MEIVLFDGCIFFLRRLVKITSCLILNSVLLLLLPFLVPPTMATPEFSDDLYKANFEEQMRYHREKMELINRENKKILANYKTTKVYNGWCCLSYSKYLTVTNNLFNFRLQERPSEALRGFKRERDTA